MKKISTKLFLIIFCCSLICVCILGGVSLLESSTRAKADAQSALQWMVRDYADKFSTEFILIEEQIGRIERFVTETLDFEALKKDKDYLSRYEPTLAEFVKQYADTHTQSYSGWVYFDPKWSDAPNDVYFVDTNNDKSADRQAHIPFSYYDNTPLPNDDKQWWYGPIQSQGTFWTNPYEWDVTDNARIQVVSCARPVYFEGEFVCVVGTYYLFNDMQKEIQDIKVFDTGYAALFNEKLDVIIHPTLQSGTRYTSDNLFAVNDGAHSTLAQQMSDQYFGVQSYQQNNESQIMAFAKLSNGWVLGITPPVNEMYSGLYAMTYKLLGAIAFCVLLSLAAAYFLGKFIAQPILTVATAAKRIGSGDLATRVQVKTKDEIKLLADAINHMTTNMRSLQEELIQQAYYDELTGAKNLTKFKLDVKALLEKNPNLDYCLIKFDIDRFKLFNELHGFDEGNKLLKNVVKAIGMVTNSEHDTFARVTSDEFTVFMQSHSMEDSAKERKNFEKAFHSLTSQDLGYKILFPAGRYALEKGETDVTAMFEKVNIAHRFAKQSKDFSMVYDYSVNVKKIAIKEKEIENSMERALQQEEFKLYLQPKYRLLDETVAGAEALVRWQTGGKDLIYPNDFIPLFERNGFITKLDFYMFEKTCQALRSWLDMGITPVTVSVNFSRLHISNPAFLPELCAISNRYDIPRNLLELELTESAMFNNAEAVVAFMDQLHAAGFTLSMDDFGTGYSSLGLLKNLAVDVVKIDRSFFMDATDEYRSRAVIETIIEMTKKLNIHTVAEGVEEQKHIDLLRALGCDIVQGYYYAKPSPTDAFTQLLKDHPPSPTL